MQEEFELTYLIKNFPSAFNDAHETKEILDIYIPASAEHAFLRIRKRGDVFEITKKVLANGTDSSHQIENTIPLTQEEFDDLAQTEGKRVRKIRHYYEENGIMYEIDVFQDKLEGLVLVDVEFNSNAAKDKFIKPDWFLADVTQDKLVAGGVLSGKSYADIEHNLALYNYQKILIRN